MQYRTKFLSFIEDLACLLKCSLRELDFLSEMNYLTELDYRLYVLAYKSSFIEAELYNIYNVYSKIVSVNTFSK